MNRRRTLAYLVAIVLASGVLGTSGMAAPAGAAVEPMPSAAVSVAPAPQLLPLRVGHLPIAGNLDVVVAREQGLYAEEGLAVELTAMAGGAEILPAIIGGSLDVGTVNVVTHVLAHDQGFRARAIAGVLASRRNDPLHGILVRADSPIQSARDLEGRTLATNTLNNIDHIMQLVWIQQRGGDPRRVNIVEIPFPQHPAALAQGRVDAIGPTEPFVTMALSQGARLLAYHYGEVNEVTLLAYYGATDDWLSRNGDLARRFYRATQRADDLLFGDRDELRAAAVRHLNMNPELAARVGYGENHARVDPALVGWWIDTLRGLNLVTNQHNPADFVYDTVR
jgi:NitT/TauT family transport system substrate-binding protein